jgi:hypothetical protein
MKHDDQSYVLAAARVARLRLALAINEVDVLGISLRAGIITPTTAAAWLLTEVGELLDAREAAA